MTRWFLSLSPIAQGTLAGVGTWLLTALGSVPVLYARQAPRRLMDALMGFAGGVMVAAACWSLLVPALRLGGVWVAVAGLFAGAALIYALDQALPHLHPEFPDEARREGPIVAWRRSGRTRQQRVPRAAMERRVGSARSKRGSRRSESDPGPQPPRSPFARG